MEKKRTFSCFKVLILFFMVVVAAVFFLKYIVFRSDVEMTFTAHSVDESIRKLENLSDKYGYDNALSDLTEKNTTEFDGDTYYRLQQNYQGIPVYGRTIVCATDENGNAISVTGNVVDIDENICLTPTVTDEQIIASLYAWAVENISSTDSAEISVKEIPDKELCIFYSDATEETFLSYQLYWNTYEIVVDAYGAEILSVNELMREDVASGTLLGQLQEHKDVEYEQKNGIFSLIDDTRNMIAYTIKSEDKFIWGYLDNISIWTSEDIVMWTEQGSPDPSAVDAYAYTQITYDFFSEELNNHSVDGNGFFPISIFTGLKYMQFDSGWAGYKTFQGNAFNYAAYKNGKPLTYLVFGIGKDGYPALSAYIDTVAHEYMHGITELHSGLIYSGESGAIDEAQCECIAEAFDAVGIYDAEHSLEILIDCDQNVSPDSKLNVYNIDRNLHPRYTLNIVGTIAEHELSYNTNILSDRGFRYETTKSITTAASYHLDLPDGYYIFTITDKNNPQLEYKFTVSVSDNGTEDIIELYTDFEDKLIVKATDHSTVMVTDGKNDDTDTIALSVESRTGLHCEWSVSGDFDDDGIDEIYAFIRTSATDYSNGQLWYFTILKDRCLFYFDEDESKLFCNVVKSIPDWLAVKLIDAVNNIDKLISDIERRYF
ncbi:MAG: hypothetical protein ACI4DV_08950 [Lachnospiraceae bacterium]